MLPWEAPSDECDEDRLCLGLSYSQNHSKLGFKSKGTDQLLIKQVPCLHLRDLSLLVPPSVSLFSLIVFTEGEGTFGIEKTVKL